MSLTGYPDAPPARVGVSIGDIAAGLFLAAGISAALVRRGESGRGAMVDVAMLDCQLAILENALTTLPGHRRGAATGSARVTRTSRRSRPSRPATAGCSSSARGTTRSSPRCATCDRPPGAGARRRASSPPMPDAGTSTSSQDDPRAAAPHASRGRVARPLRARRHSVRAGEHGRGRRPHAPGGRAAHGRRHRRPRDRRASRSRATRSRSTAYPIRSRGGRRPTSTRTARRSSPGWTGPEAERRRSAAASAVDAPDARAAGRDEEEGEAVEHRQLALVDDRQERVRAVGHPVGERHEPAGTGTRPIA